MPVSKKGGENCTPPHTLICPSTSLCACRPGLIGWTAINLGFACKQLEDTGEVSVPMMMVVGLQGLYVWDALYHEQVWWG